MIRFCPFGSTKIGATPLDTPSTIPTCLLSIPNAAKFFTVASPNRSLPTLAIITTSAPHSRAATAWFAPLPPNPRSKLFPKIVSPVRGNVSLKVVKSVLALPIIATRGNPGILFPRKTRHEPITVAQNEQAYQQTNHEPWVRGSVGSVKGLNSKQ